MNHHVNIWIAPFPLPLKTMGDTYSFHPGYVRKQLRLASQELRRYALSAAVAHTVSPELWRFVYGYAGKPQVDRTQGLPAIHFSCSYRRDLVCVATSTTCNLGVDVEQYRGLSPELFLSPQEQAWLQEREDPSALIRFWTLKEAYAKMTGRGVQLDFCRIAFSLEPLKITVSPCESYPVSSLYLEHQSLSMRWPYCLSLVAQCPSSDTLTCTTHKLNEGWNVSITNDV